MLQYLDTAIVIYAVEGSESDRQRTSDCLRLIEAAGHQFAISDLTRAECLVGATDGQTLADYTAFFLGPNTRTLVLGSAAYGERPRFAAADIFPRPRTAR